MSFILRMTKAEHSVINFYPAILTPTVTSILNPALSESRTTSPVSEL